MFTDEATIEATAGSGGGGCVSWRREKYVAKGGPDGGDGGRGGNVYVVAQENTDTLSHFSSTKHFRAESGSSGRGQNKHGKNGEDLLLAVPPGTIVYNAETGEQLADLQHIGEQVLIVEGGRGGYGNAHFVSSVRQRPDFAELGEPGQTMMLKLELKLIADVGIIGFPNVGKSTLISVISAAKPKIANYEFTTIIPNLGVVQIDERSYVVCDVPGLIEGASEGKGLGDTFLKHIERTAVLLHVLDVSRNLEVGNTVDEEKMIEDYQTIRKELTNYSLALKEKQELVIVNKIDLISEEELTRVLSALKKAGISVSLALSAATLENTQELKRLLLAPVLEEREKRALYRPAPKTDLPVLTPQRDEEQMRAFEVQNIDGSLHVTGKRIEQFTVMTDFTSTGAVGRFRDVVDRIGLLTALKREGRSEDTPVFIGKVQVDSYL